MIVGLRTESASPLTPDVRQSRRHSMLGANGRVALALLMVGGLIVAMVHGAGDERELVGIVQRARPVWLFVAIALQVGTYLCLARAWELAIASFGARPPSISRLVGTALAQLFTDQTLPSGGIGGMLFVVSSLRRYGTPTAAASAAVVMSLLGFYIAQLVAIIGCVASLSLRGQLVNGTAAAALGALALAIGIPVVVIASARGGIAKLPKRVRHLRTAIALRRAITAAPREALLDPRRVGPIAALRIGIIALDGATLAAAFAALGWSVPLDIVMTAFVIASIVGSVSFLPGGLGTFEAAASTLLVVSGVPLEVSVAAVLLMRGFSFWLPMLPGFWLVRRELRSDASARCQMPDARRLTPDA